MNSSYFLNLIIALAYFIGGYAGLWLAISPTNAAPMWPAAGVALVACYLFGRTALPGVLIGALLIQIYSVYDHSAPEKILDSIFFGTIISLGSYAQAAFGAWLITRKISPDDALIEDDKILRFLALGGPVSCTIAATTGATALFISGAINYDQYLLVWTTWWIGDTIGVLVCAPILLIFFAAPRTLWRQRIVTVALPLFILLAAVSLLFAYGNRQERLRITLEFEQQVMRAHSAIEQVISDFIHINQDIKNLFSSIPELSEDEFLRFTEPLVASHPFVQAVEWIPRIHHADRAAFEANLGQAIMHSTFGPGSSRQMLPAEQRTEYYPVAYLQPYAGNERALGYDVSSNPRAFAAMQMALENGHSAITEPIQLVQDLSPAMGAVIYTPVYHTQYIPKTMAERKQALKGFIAGVFYLKHPISATFLERPNLQLNLVVSDGNATVFSNKLTDQPFITDPFNLHKIQSLKVLNREWILRYTPSEDFFHQQLSGNIWWLMLSGFSFVALTGTSLLMLTGRTLRTEQLVKQRTQELEQEVTRRKQIIGEREAHNQILQDIIESKPLDKILNQIIITAENICPGMMGSILLLDEDKHHLYIAAAPNMPDAYQAVNGLKIGDGVGSCGTAAYRLERVIIEDVHTHPYWTDYRELAKELGITSCWSEPIFTPSGTIIGTFTLYYPGRQKPDQVTLELIEDFAKLISLAIGKHETEAQIVQLALYDELTSLPNRRLFLDHLAQEISTAQERGFFSVILFLDLDNFKTLNDSLGHAIGDKLLIQAAQRLKECCRSEDMAARLGGDEFVVMLSGISDNSTDRDKMLNYALRVAQRIQTSINKVYLLDQYEHHVSCSIGITIFPQAEKNPDQLLQQADTAMYSSKATGRNSICFYHPDMQVKADKRLELEKGLKTAFDEQQFVLYYQPQYHYQQQKIVSAEVLLRWQHPEKGLIAPAEFIDIAEETGLIIPLGQWIMREACRQLTHWPELDYLAINISPRQFLDPHFEQSIQDALTYNQLPARRLMLEVIESDLMEDFENSLRMMKLLQQMGIRIAIDDFGTGYSSLAYLRNLPVNQLKIDRSFIRDILTNPNDAVIATTIIAMAQHLDLDIVAEGVEWTKQVEFLKNRACYTMQGYFFSRPLMAGQLTELLACTVEARPVEARPVEAQPVEARPVEARPVEARPVEARPVEARPVEARPVEARPAKVRPAGNISIMK